MGKWGKEHVCNKCGFVRNTKIGIKVHLARTHNELETHYDLNCPYCTGVYRTLQSLNRHLRTPTCKQIINGRKTQFTTSNRLGESMERHLRLK